MENNFVKIGNRVSIISIITNIFLSVFKFIAGIIGKSNAMLSDSIHSFSDVLSTIVVIIGINMSRKKDDNNHPYGHERIECVAAFILAIFLCITGLGIGWIGLKTILFSKYSDIKIPTTIALIAALVSIVVKEGMYWYTISASKKINSDALKADAWHHRSDALSSIGSLIGIGGAMFGFKLLDPIASIIISFCIIKVAFDIFIDSVDKMIDKACSDEFTQELKETILSVDGVVEIDDIKTRLFANKIYVDVEIGADENLKLKKAHQTAEDVHNKLEEKYKDIKHCMVHVNPKKIK